MAIQGLSTFILSFGLLKNTETRIGFIPFEWLSCSTTDDITLPSHPVPYPTMGKYTKVEPVTISYSGCTFKDPISGFSGSYMQALRFLKIYQQTKPLILTGGDLDGPVLIQSFSDTVDTTYVSGQFNLTLRYYDYSDLAVEIIGNISPTEVTEVKTVPALQSADNAARVSS